MLRIRDRITTRRWADLFIGAIALILLCHPILAEEDGLRVFESDEFASKQPNGSTIIDAIESRLRASSDPLIASDEQAVFEPLKEPDSSEINLEDDASVVELHHTPTLYLLFNAATMALTLVFAAIVFPIALAYRMSGSFRQALQAINSRTSGSSGGRGKKDMDVEMTIKRNEEFVPELIVSVNNLRSASSVSAVGFQPVLSQKGAQRLIPHLPFHLTAKDWQLLYASKLHGYSLHSAYRRISAMGPCVLVGMDVNRGVFACFCSENLKPNGASYFGNGECWVASLSPRFQVFKWTPGSNEQFVLATDSFLAFGGGGTFALWLDAQFDRGTSEPNTTYGNATFLASSEIFQIVSIEVWGFAPPSLRSSLRTKAMSTVSSVMGRIASKTSFAKD